MAITDPAQALFLGITLKDAVTAILIPIIAVLTTLIVQDRQQTRERRTQILRMLLSTRHIPADAAFNAAINLIPVEFNKARGVMSAWSAYMESVRFSVPQGDEAVVEGQRKAKQTKLIAAIMRSLGLTHSEADLQVDAYLSTGFVQRDNIYLDSLLAQRDAAEAMKQVAEALRAQAAMLYQQMTGTLPPPSAPTGT